MKKILSLFLTLVLCAGLAIPASAAGFSDIPADHWAKEPIDQMAQAGIIGGYSDGSFRPAAPVSYAAFSLMLARAFYPGELAAYPNGGTQAGEAIMNRHNILNGTGRASKSSGADFPREDMAQCMYNVLVDKGAAIPSVQEQSAAMASIRDFNDIEYNCRKGVLACYALGLLTGQGDGSFGPKNSMNRAQAAVVIGRLRDYVQSNGGTAGAVEIPNETEPKAPPISENAPEVTELPEFKLLPGENVQQMMDRICTSNYVPGYLSNGEAITDEHIEGILADIESSMPQDTEWNRDARYYYSGAIGNGTACNSWAYALSDYIFTKSAPVVTHQNFDKIKVGDVVWVRNSKTGYSHVYVATSMESPPGYGPGRFYQCSGNVNGKVSWGDVGALKGYGGFESPEIMSVSYVYSRY